MGVYRLSRPGFVQWPKEILPNIYVSEPNITSKKKSEQYPTLAPEKNQLENC